MLHYRDVNGLSCYVLIPRWNACRKSSKGEKEVSLEDELAAVDTTEHRVDNGYDTSTHPNSFSWKMESNISRGNTTETYTDEHGNRMPIPTDSTQASSNVFEAAETPKNVPPRPTLQETGINPHDYNSDSEPEKRIKSEDDENNPSEVDKPNNSPAVVADKGTDGPMADKRTDRATADLVI